MFSCTPSSKPLQPASVAQSGPHLTGDQKATGSIPAGSGNILSWKLIMNIFKGELSVSGERMCTSTGQLIRYKLAQ